jgi:hypothetical protein
MMPDQESLCSRRALMISPLLEMHNSQRFHRLVEIVAMNKLSDSVVQSMLDGLASKLPALPPGTWLGPQRSFE